MIINFSRISRIEDPIDFITKEMQKDKNKGSTMSIFKNSVMSIGNSFGLNNSQEINPKNDQHKNLPKTSSFAVDKHKNENPEKPQYRSSGIFDTLFRPLEPKSKKPPKQTTERSSRASYFGTVKENNVHIFFINILVYFNQFRVRMIQI